MKSRIALTVILIFIFNVINSSLYVYAKENSVGLMPIPADAIFISSRAELALIGGPQSTGKYYVLKNDIWLTSEWTPINDFCGTFDGRGHVVHNLYVLESSGRQYAGLFGNLGYYTHEDWLYNTEQTVATTITIKNVGVNIGSDGITAVSDWGSQAIYAGGLIGSCDADNYEYNILVENCYATGSVSTISTTGSIRPAFSGAGGLIGSCSTAWGTITVKNCYASGNVTAVSYYVDSASAGGLIGELSTNQENGPIFIENCYATGNASAYSMLSGDDRFPVYAASAGGLIGRSDESARISEITIKNCYATGNVFSSSNKHFIAGRIIGASYDNVTISDCPVSSTQKVSSGIWESSLSLDDLRDTLKNKEAPKTGDNAPYPIIWPRNFLILRRILNKLTGG